MHHFTSVNAIIMSSGVSSKLDADWWKAKLVADMAENFVFLQIINNQDNVMKPFICVAFR